MSTVQYTTSRTPTLYQGKLDGIHILEPALSLVMK